MHGVGDLVGAFVCRLPDAFDPRRMRTVAARALGRDGPQCRRGEPAGGGRVVSADQRRAGGEAAQGVFQTGPAGGNRPDGDPLSRASVPSRGGNSSRQTQKRHVAFSLLRQRVRVSDGAAVHAGGDAGSGGTEDGDGGPATVAAGPLAGRESRFFCCWTRSFSAWAWFGTCRRPAARS